MYVSEDVRIRGYSSKPKGVREREGLGNTGLAHWSRHGTGVERCWGEHASHSTFNDADSTARSLWHRMTWKFDL
jgi:hypothetical protein